MGADQLPGQRVTTEDASAHQPCSYGTACPACAALTVALAPVGKRERVRHLDAIRGLAVLVMVVDHVSIVADVLPLRLTVGRLAVPLFFILAGHLARRLSARTLWAAALGLALPGFAPWIDAPNVLLWYAVGVAMLVLARRVGCPLALLVALPLTLAANSWGSPLLTGYNPLCLLGLMALGAMLHRSAFAWGVRLPGFLAVLGRYPLTVYVGHVLALTWLTSAV